jgi:hypothetical protein
MDGRQRLAIQRVERKKEPRSGALRCAALHITALIRSERTSPSSAVAPANMVNLWCLRRAGPRLDAGHSLRTVTPVRSTNSWADKGKRQQLEKKSIVSKTIGGTIKSKCLQQILATG